MARPRMTEKTRPLNDGKLQTRAAEDFAKRRELPIVAQLYDHLRTHPRPWWTLTFLRKRWPTRERLKWFEERPDLRAKITHELTGLPIGTASDSDLGFQAEVIDRVVASGDVTPEQWETSFSAADIALHGPTGLIWQTFRHRFPWDARSDEDRKVLRWLFEELLTPRSRPNLPDSPVLSPLYLRSAIDVRVWQESIPLELRIQIDAQRLRKELEGEPFTCRDEIGVVTIERIVEHIPVDQLQGVLDALERVLPGLASPGLSPEDLAMPTDESENTESLARVLS